MKSMRDGQRGWPGARSAVKTTAPLSTPTSSGDRPA